MGAADALTTEMRHAKFVEEFFIDCDVDRAYAAVGYQGKPGWSRRSSIGQLCSNPLVQVQMRAKLAELRRKVDLDQQQHAIAVCELAYSDLRDVASWDATGLRLHPSDTLSPAAARTIQKVTSRTRTRMEVRNGEATPLTEVETEVVLHPKMHALDLLHRMYDKSQALRTELEAKLRAIAQVGARYVPEAEMSRYLAEVRLALGDLGETPPDAQTRPLLP